MQYDLEFLNSCKGLPWNTTGKQELNSLKRGDPLTAGTGMRGIYITKQLLDKYGRTDGCPKCEEWGASHSEACRARISQRMISAGEAFEHREAPAPSAAGGELWRRRE